MPKYIYLILVVSNLFSQVDYTTQIQPIFDNNCTSCHSDGGTYFGGLDLSSYSLVIEGGSSGNTIVPLDHSGSELFNRITLDESDNEFMPKYGTPLSQTEIDLIAQWIDEGALETPVDADCYAEDGSEGVEIWGICYSIENTAVFGWPISIPDTATSIPNKLFSLVNLTTLSITYTNISEPIPPEIGSLVNLTKLNLSNNLISGEIPSAIGNLINLTSLNLSSNQLSGNIPLELYELSHLEGEVEVVTGPGGGASILNMGLNLSNNMLSGPILEELGNLSNLKFLDLSFNELSGSIPISLYTLDSLQTLNLSHNFLSGEISPLISNLSSLSGIVTTSHMSIITYLALDLSANQFSGVIPEELCSISIDWNGNMFSDSLFSVHQNQFCPPYPTCIENRIGSQDTLNCDGFFDGCIDLTGVDFGECDMALGIGWVNSSCENISGCDWIVDSVDYTGAFFTSMDSCQQICMVLYNDEDPLFPSSYNLYKNYPNPFNPITTLRYDIPKDSFVDITIYDMLGNVVNNLVNTYQSSGNKSIQWNATNNQGKPVSAGVYLYKIQAGDFVDTKKMILLK